MREIYRTPPAACEWHPQHLTVIVYTRRLRDGFRRRHWLRCFECDLRLGPLRPAPPRG